MATQKTKSPLATDDDEAKRREERRRNLIETIRGSLDAEEEGATSDDESGEEGAGLDQTAGMVAQTPTTGAPATQTPTIGAPATQTPTTQTPTTGADSYGGLGETYNYFTSSDYLADRADARAKYGGPVAESKRLLGMDPNYRAPMSEESAELLKSGDELLGIIRNVNAAQKIIDGSKESDRRKQFVESRGMSVSPFVKEVGQDRDMATQLLAKDRETLERDPSNPFKDQIEARVAAREYAINQADYLRQRDTPTEQPSVEETAATAATATATATAPEIAEQGEVDQAPTTTNEVVEEKPEEKPKSKEQRRMEAMDWARRTSGVSTKRDQYGNIIPVEMNEDQRLAKAAQYRARGANRLADSLLGIKQPKSRALGRPSSRLLRQARRYRRMGFSGAANQLAAQAAAMDARTPSIITEEMRDRRRQILAAHQRRAAQEERERERDRGPVRLPQQPTDVEPFPVFGLDRNPRTGR